MSGDIGGRTVCTGQEVDRKRLEVVGVDRILAGEEERRRHLEQGIGELGRARRTVAEEERRTVGPGEERRTVGQVEEHRMAGWVGERRMVVVMARHMAGARGHRMVEAGEAVRSPGEGAVDSTGLEEEERRIAGRAVVAGSNPLVAEGVLGFVSNAP